jgi:tight adherence protein C
LNELFLYLLAGGSVGLLVWSFMGGREKGKADQEDSSKAQIKDADVVEAGSGLKKTLSRCPNLVGSIEQAMDLHQIDENHPWKKVMTSFDLLLLRSGHRGGLTAQDLANLTVYGAFLTSTFLGIYALSLEITALPFVYGGFLLGGILPWLVFKSRVQVRQQRIRKDLPYLLDLLTLCVESGMDFTTAMLRVGPNFQGTELGEEVSLLVTELRMGKGREEGLRDLSRRVGIMELSTVVNSIVQSDKLGSGMGPALRIQSEDMRKHRMFQAEEAGMKAPVKLVFPLVFFIFPTTFIILFAPMFIKMMS